MKVGFTNARWNEYDAIHSRLRWIFGPASFHPLSEMGFSNEEGSTSKG